MACCCPGGFCELVLPIDNDNFLSITSNNGATTLPNKKGPASLSKREKRLQNSLERERIIGLLKWVLTTEEYAELEETGNLVRLRANKSQGDTITSSDKTHNRCGFWMDAESISLAKKEHRPNLARLAFAEFQSLSNHDCNSDGDRELNTTIVLPSSSGNEGDVAVCGICFNVHTLLKQARKLLASLHQIVEDQDEKKTGLDIRLESGNNQPASLASSNPLDGKEGASSTTLSKPSRKGPLRPSKLDSASGKEEPTTSPRQKSEDRNELKSKRKAKQRKRDRDKLEKNSKTLILVAETEEATSNLAKQILEKEGYTVDSVSNVADCLQALKNKTYSILLMNENLTGKDDESTALRIRQADASSKRQVKMRILVVVQNILSINYHAYEEAEVDGFLPVPLESTKLVSSIRKAVSQYSEAVLRAERKRISDAKSLSLHEMSGGVRNNDRNPMNPKTVNTKQVKTAASSVVRGLTTKVKKKEPVTFESRFQYDDKTSFPYAIIENCSDEPTTQSSEDHHPLWCNLLVCHDVFDTYERFKIFFHPMVARYPGMKILLWNYPGQAFTSFPDDANLNNKYHADCLSKLLDHLGGTEKGKLFMKEQCFILAHGSGAAIATFFAANQRAMNLSGIILVNGLSHVDSHFASIFHDCRNVFSCSPESRPDLPVYFYARFLFSPSYLNKTTSSLALNVYTAVHNPITLNGRKRLCQGVLNHVDTRPMLKDISSPIISIHGENATLVRAIHSSEFLTGRRSCETIPQALKGGNRTAIVMMKGGHELFQEKKYHISLLVEQILTGFHEKIRVHQQPTLDFDDMQVGSNSSHDFLFTETKVEDVFLDKIVQDSRANQNPWDRYNNEIMTDNESRIHDKSQLRRPALEKEIKKKTSESKNDVDGYENPEVKEVKEYMAWRIKRQKKRLAIMEHSAIIIQCALRSYMAKTLKHRLRKQRAATRIQCFMRGIFGRYVYQGRKKELLAAIFVQRATRGYLARCTAFNKRLELRAQKDLARIVRGVAARRKYQAVLTKRENSASELQCLWRMHAAIVLKKMHRTRRLASTTIQKCYRGHLGRKGAALEREQYIFSRNQLSGIESGRQILSQHKLLALNLQSDVCLLDQEKEKIEKKIDFHSTEIRNYERNVSELETRMHLIFNGEIVCASESVVREEKKKINEEITDVKAKILDRKEKLGALQQSLEQLLRDRHDKSEQSKVLEAKLSVLLDAQVVALEGALDKKWCRVQRVVTSHTFPTSPDQSSFIESNVLIHSPDPPELTSSSSGATKKGKLQALHFTELKNNDYDVENTPENQIQLVEHRLSSMASPSASKQSLQTQKNDKILSAQREKVEAQRLFFVGNIQNQDQLHSSSTSSSNAKHVTDERASNHNYFGPSEKDKLQAAQLIDSTETMLKFGFMSMSLTYFSTLNMMRAMQKVAVTDALSTSAVDGEDSPDAVANNALAHSRNLDKRSTPHVESWSINDVSKWLASISLSQYQSAFKEGAVDGAFLCELTDEDLRNTLGVEHRLHRKKILFSIRCLKNYSEVPPIHSPTNALSVVPSRLYTANENIETQMSTNPTMYDDISMVDAANAGRYANHNHESMSPKSLMKSPGKPISVRDMLTPSNADSARYLDPDYAPDSKSASKSNSKRDILMSPTKSDMSPIPKCNYEQLSAWVRHQKYDSIRDALDHMPDLHFEGKKHIRVQFVQDIGTAYTPQYEQHEPFHLNKVDEHGNTLVHITAQTGNIKICKLLLRKGANPNHQNKLGQTPGHFAVAYQFFEFASWLFDEKGGGADDLLTNMYGLGPYDGLQR